MQSSRRGLLGIAGLAAGLANLPAAAKARSRATGARLSGFAPGWEDPATIGPPAELVGRTGLLDGAAKGIWCADSGGAGPAVVLLHAHTGTAQSWGYQHAALAQKGYRAIAYSRRGAGDSVATGSKPLADLIAVLDTLGVRKCHLVGIAAGGFVGVEAMSSAAARLSSVTLCCTMGGIRDDGLLARSNAIQPPEFHALPAEMREISPSYRYANPDGMARWRQIYSQSLSARQAAAPLAAADRDAMRRAALAGGPSLAAVAGSGVPIELIYADADLYSPPAMGRLLAARLGGAGIRVIAEAGHNANWEQPKAFNTALFDVLSRHRQSR